MVNFGPLAAEIGSLVWGTSTNLHRFHVLAALLHGTLVVAAAKHCGIERRAPPIFGRAPSRWALAHILVLYRIVLHVIVFCQDFSDEEPVFLGCIGCSLSWVMIEIKWFVIR